jgi:hypothetical protein
MERNIPADVASTLVVLVLIISRKFFLPALNILIAFDVMLQSSQVDPTIVTIRFDPWKKITGKMAIRTSGF